jgi:hypothetical protein
VQRKEESKRKPRKPAASAKAGTQDLTALLVGWAYDEAKPVRRINTEDGREVLQVRLPLGLEQYEIDGRPDGKHPMSYESWFHYYCHQARASSRDEREFSLSEGDFSRLQQEGLLYYHRYLLFFQLREYALCTRDTRRNLKLLDFVTQNFPCEQADLLEQYRPYILRMNVMARALYRIQKHEDVEGALRILHAGTQSIQGLAEIENNQVFQFERARSLASIEDLITQLEAHAPKHVALENELEKAVRGEQYEKAAALRDELARLKQKPPR